MRKWLFLSVLFLWGCEDHQEIFDPIDTTLIDSVVENVCGNLECTCTCAPHQEFPSGAIAYYPFNGNANDESGNGNHGTVNGSILTLDRNGSFDSAYNFENSNIIIDNSFYNNGLENYTINLWFLTGDSTQLNQTFFNTLSHDGEGIAYNHTNVREKFSHWKNSDVENHAWDIFSGNSLENGEIENSIWYMITVIKEISSTHYYINGELIKSSNINLEALSQTTQIVLGSNSYGYENLNGSLDDIGIWDRVLTEEEIDYLYKN
jgi:hypothetical protein